MSTNQSHGKSYENYVKVAFPGASDHNRLPSSSWDIEKEFDKQNSLSTSIKTTKNEIVGLADARKFWSIDEPYRLLIGTYKQNSGIKTFQKLFEYRITIAEHSKILGNITFSEVEDFHNALSGFKLGLHRQARTFAKFKKSSLKSRSIVQLNPKIDSGMQRRLQCSITLNSLNGNVKDKYVYDSFYRGISVNFIIQSNEREFNK